MSEELNDELVGKKMGAVWLGLASYLRETASSTFAQSLAPREGTE